MLLYHEADFFFFSQNVWGIITVLTMIQKDVTVVLTQKNPDQTSVLVNGRFQFILMP